MQAQLSRPGPAGGRSSRLSRRPGLSERQAQEPLHRQREHAGHEVAQHLAADAHAAPAAIVLQAAVDTLHRRALPVAQLRRIRPPGAAQRLGLPFQIRLQLRPAASSVRPRGLTSMSGTCPSRSLKAPIPAASRALSIRSYRLPTRPAVRVASGIAAWSRPDRGLAVVQRSRGEQAADRDPAVDRVDRQLVAMQLVAAPADGMALGVALGAGIAVLRQVVQHEPFARIPS